MVNVGKYTIHGSYWIENGFFTPFTSPGESWFRHFLRALYHGHCLRADQGHLGEGLFPSPGETRFRCRKCPPLDWFTRISFTASENPLKIHLSCLKPWGSWLTETENGFMEAKYLAFLFGGYTPLVRPLTFGEPGSLGKRKGSFFSSIDFSRAKFAVFQRFSQRVGTRWGPTWNNPINGLWNG